MSVVGRERLAAGRQVVVARRGSSGARQRGSARAPRAPARLARHVARFPHRRSYNTPNTELFISPLGRTTEFGRVGRTDRRECARDQRVECLTSVGGRGAGAERHRERDLVIEHSSGAQRRSTFTIGYPRSSRIHTTARCQHALAAPASVLHSRI